MIQSTTWLVALLGLAAVAIIIILLLAPTKDPASASGKEDAVAVNAAEGSIVTVRKVGRVTSVTIRSEVHDHWEGSDGVQLPPLPVGVTRQERPDLYAEYLSAETPALRKYEIADQLYSEGFTLPYIRGLHEQYKRELGSGSRKAPVDLSARHASEAPYRELEIDDALRHVPVEEMDEAPAGQQ